MVYEVSKDSKLGSNSCLQAQPLWDLLNLTAATG